MRTLDAVLLGLVLWAQEAFLEAPPPHPPLRGPVAALAPWEPLLREKTGPRWIARGAQLLQESGGNPRAVSHAGAQGLMQAMPRSWVGYQARGWVSKDASPFDPDWSIVGGDRHMLVLEGRFPDNREQALVAYNAGERVVFRATSLARTLGLPGRDGWKQALPRVMKRPENAREPLGYIRRIPRLEAEIRRQREAT